jgi:rhodanese-related sulfurtransferase
MTMESILQVAPAAQRALFQRYHVGGCSACGFQPADTLAQVCKDHNILDVNEVIRTIQLAQEMDSTMQVDAPTLQAWMEEGQDLTLIDVRMPGDLGKGSIQGAEPLDYADSGKYMSLPKDRRIVFACQDGQRSLDVSAYFRGHGFTEVRSLRGGIDAWIRQAIPSSQPRE